MLLLLEVLLNRLAIQLAVIGRFTCSVHICDKFRLEGMLFLVFPLKLLSASF